MLLIKYWHLELCKHFEILSLLFRMLLFLVMVVMVLHVSSSLMCFSILFNSNKIAPSRRHDLLLRCVFYTWWILLSATENFWDV